VAKIFVESSVGIEVRGFSCVRELFYQQFLLSEFRNYVENKRFSVS
jgi:hypothetical protein